jgi:predicted SprT family Zn-dependent metalloprotease
MYNSPMIKITEQYLQTLAEIKWAEYCEIFPKLVKFDCPKIVLNNRLTSTGGRCFSWLNKVDLATKFFVNNQDAMLRITLPHELAHQIDRNLNGDCMNRHHRQSWKEIMIKIGLPPDRCHFMKL